MCKELCVLPGTTTRLGPCLVTSLPNARKVEGGVMNGIRSVTRCVLHCVLAEYAVPCWHWHYVLNME